MCTNVYKRFRPNTFQKINASQKNKTRAYACLGSPPELRRVSVSPPTPRLPVSRGRERRSLETRFGKRYHAPIPASKSLRTRKPAMRSTICFALASILIAVLTVSAFADVGVKKTDSGVEVTVDGQPFTTYIFDSGFK